MSEIDLRWELISVTGVCFGMGIISACFHDRGSLASAKEQLTISVTIGANKSAFSLNNHVGMWSGPEAFVGLSDKSFFKNPRIRH